MHPKPRTAVDKAFVGHVSSLQQGMQLDQLWEGCWQGGRPGSGFASLGQSLKN